MEELITYFEHLEARLASLEARVKALEEAAQAEPAQDAKIETLMAQMALLQSNYSNLTTQIETACEEMKQQTVQEERYDNDSEDVALDEESGLPELEVELIEEEEPAAPEVPEKQETPKVPETPNETEKQDGPEKPTQPVQEIAKESVSSVVPKIEDIRKAISLGDRFLFQRELFSGNGELMNKTIETLNGLGNMAEAEAFVAKNFPNWDKESNAYELFHNLLKRRW